MIKGFEPIIDNKCSILILGSMPGEESLRKGQYYGNPRNHFWRIIFTLLNEKDPEKYESRKLKLLENHIAIWDVLASCERETSSDSKIKEPTANDFNWLFSTYPNIRSVFFNGTTAEKLFKRLVIKNLDSFDLVFTILPSTSPANTMKFNDKLDIWKIVISALQNRKYE